MLERRCKMKTNRFQLSLVLYRNIQSKRKHRRTYTRKRIVVRVSIWFHINCVHICIETKTIGYIVRNWHKQLCRRHAAILSQRLTAHFVDSGIDFYQIARNHRHDIHNNGNAFFIKRKLLHGHGNRVNLSWINSFLCKPIEITDR